MNSELNTQAPTDKQIKSVENAIDHFKNGKMVIIVDDEGRENEGDIALPAQDCNPEDINFMGISSQHTNQSQPPNAYIPLYYVNGGHRLPKIQLLPV